MAKTALYLILGILALPAHAQALKGELACKTAGTDFVYDCTLRLTRGGKPLEGAQVTVGADMPAMPMAHNVKAQKARPGTRPGEYVVRLDLEMLGEWAVRLRLRGPVRDQLILHYEFGDKGAVPVRRRR